MTPRQAIVLAAGLGTRLRPLTHRTPKPLLPVGGLPILLFNLFLLKEAGIRRIVLNLHHLPGAFRRQFRDGKSLGLKISYSFEPKILGTAGGIAQALEGLEDRSTFVLNGDIIFDLDLKKMAEAHRRSGARATLACIPKDRAKVDSFVEYDARGRIRRIAGGPPLAKPAPRLQKAIFSGAHLLEPGLFKNYPHGTFGCVIRQVYQPALARGEALQAFSHRGSWWDLGSPAELTKVDRSLWRGTAPKPIQGLWAEARAWAAKGKFS